MACPVQYFKHTDGFYEPAATKRPVKPKSNTSSRERLERRTKFILLDIIPKVIKWHVCVFVALLRDIVQRILPAQKKSITGQVALVTGGANGLGQALCHRLAQEGCAVAVVDIDLVGARITAEEVRQRFGVKVAAFQVDVSDYESIVQLRKDVESTLGPVDILVNNAALLAMLSLSEGKPEDVQRIVNVNLLSHFWTIREFKDGMVERRRGHIVAISSMLGVVPTGRSICYCATKFAVRGLMDSLNEEFYLDGLSKDVHTTCVFPAGIRTRKQFVDLMADISLNIPWHTPQYVANATIEGVLTNKTEVVPSTWHVKIIFKIISIVPKTMIRLTTEIFVGKVPPLSGRS